jgi:hypothetical protein
VPIGYQERQLNAEAKGQVVINGKERDVDSQQIHTSKQVSYVQAHDFLSLLGRRCLEKPGKRYDGVV